MIFPILLPMLCVQVMWSADQDALVKRLEAKLLSPCCYRQSVAEHSSPEAAQMRSEIERMVAGGNSERQVIDFYKARYGMRILSEPEGPVWWVATLVPAIAAIAGVLLLSSFLYSYARSQTSDPGSAMEYKGIDL